MPALLLLLLDVVLPDPDLLVQTVKWSLCLNPHLDLERELHLQVNVLQPWALVKSPSMARVQEQDLVKAKPQGQLKVQAANVEARVELLGVVSVKVRLKVKAKVRALAEARAWAQAQA